MSATKRASSRRRGKTVSGADKWKNKEWLEIKAPDYVDDKVLGETFTSNTDSVVGRVVQISLMDLTGSFKDLNYQLSFKVNEVAGRVAKTEFFQQELSRDFRRSQIRNHRSQIEGIFNFKLADDARVRIKLFVVTPSRIHSSVKKEIRMALVAKLEELTSELTFPAFVNQLIKYEITNALVPVAEEIYPVKVCEISKVKVVKLPGNKPIVGRAA